VAEEHRERGGFRLRHDEDAALGVTKPLDVRRHLPEVGHARDSGKVPQKDQQQVLGREVGRQRDGLARFGSER
jgi:hypothetical protein